MKILVTGGTGYIGRVLCPYLKEKGHDVIALDRNFLSDGSVKEEYEQFGIRLIRDDIRYFDPHVLDGVEAVADLAALSNDPAGDLDPFKTWDINHIGRVRVGRLAKRAGVSRYVVASSCSVYGFQSNTVDEKSQVNPLTTYAKANVAVEDDNLILGDKQFTATALRFATAFGYSKRMRLDIAINAMTFNAVTTKKILLMRDGTQVRPFVHIKDISRSIESVFEADQDVVNRERFNIGSDDQNISLKELGEMVRKTVNNGSAVEWYGDPDVRSYRVSFKKAMDSIGFKTKYDIAYGIKEISDKVKSGELKQTPQSKTVEFYSGLLDAESKFREYSLPGLERIL
jgi:nucleoside-diphosphate-sugar epimerase